MPKIVDHAQRRDEIAHVACQVVARHGFDQATVARIARAAGYTTGMVAHYYESKQDIILAALRLILLRIEERLTRERESGEAGLLEVLSEALAIDAQRFTECAFWMAFWGQVSADKKLKRLNVWVHREYMRLFARCFTEHAPGWGRSRVVVRQIVLVEHHPDRSIERRREPVPRHKRGRDRIANFVLERITRLTSDLQQRAMVTDLKN